MKPAMTAAQRLGTAMSHQEPDRVPFLLPLVLQGARELGLDLREYFSRAEYVAEGQWLLAAKYQHDGLVGFFYGGQEVEAFGAHIHFGPDGPPNVIEPPLRPQDLDDLQPPRIQDCPSLLRVLRVIELLKARAADTAPVMGAIISPFSLPVMQLGFDVYLDLMLEDPQRLEKLYRVNEEFSVAWGNAQLAAGAGALTYADPVSSPTIVPRDLYQRSGLPLAQRTIARLNGPCACSFASGRMLPVLDLVLQTGAIGVCPSAQDDLAAVKAACAGKVTVMGNLNAMDMVDWTEAQAEAKVKQAIAAAGAGGGFVLTDNHGEIPWQVPDSVLLAISKAVRQWGRYPLDWINS
jgi:uroporphyrinogen decarboxylase